MTDNKKTRTVKTLDQKLTDLEPADKARIINMLREQLKAQAEQAKAAADAAAAITATI